MKRVGSQVPALRAGLARHGAGEVAPALGSALCGGFLGSFSSAEKEHTFACVWLNFFTALSSSQWSLMKVVEEESELRLEN